MVYSNRRRSIRTQASYQGWFPNEATVRNINYSIDPLATAFFNDPFSWLFGENIMIVLFCPAASARSLRNSRWQAKWPTIPSFPPRSVITDDTSTPRISVRQQQEHTWTVLTGSVKGLDVTSRLIESCPFHLPSRWSKGQRGVFQPPGSHPLPLRVATHGKRVASFSLTSTISKRVVWAYS